MTAAEDQDEEYHCQLQTKPNYSKKAIFKENMTEQQITLLQNFPSLLNILP